MQQRDQHRFRRRRAIEIGEQTRAILGPQHDRLGAQAVLNLPRTDPARALAVEHGLDMRIAQVQRRFEQFRSFQDIPY